MSKKLKPCLLLMLFCVFQMCFAMKCRSEDGPSDAELKRVTRSCMQKISENVHFSNNGGYGSGSNSNFHYGSNGYHYNNNPPSNNNNNYGQQNNYRSDYDSDEDSDISDGDNYNNERSGTGGSNGHGAGSSRDIFQQHNRERSSIHNNRNNGNGNSGNGGRSNSAPNNDANNSNIGGNTNNQRNTNSKAYNNYNNNNSNGHSSSSGGNGRNMGGHNGDSNRNNGTIYDNGCIVHCFFDEMNMLNRDGYPDRHKVNYMLTKDIRDRELRNFYTDTIQSCFRYLESQRRHDKCHYSRELIHCMTEYAKANCDDWQEYNVIFN